ncbi:MAG: peptidyl-prolyl cis-trans isomerase [Vampirovibrio sp.]|nr:peptidyl-prolyl cis-trans isomerase [Vampirovibrio sp.]
MSEATQVNEVRASHLLVETEAELEQCRQEIENGTPFAEVAQRVSRCPSGERGGDLGFFTRGKMVPEFEQAAFRLPVGQISDPIKTQFGYHLLVVTEQK